MVSEKRHKKKMTVEIRIDGLKNDTFVDGVIIETSKQTRYYIFFKLNPKTLEMKAPPP
jgi:hypothetical protein